MTNTYKLINAKAEAAIPLSGLAAAINSAAPGTVITVPTAGAPIQLNLSRNIPGYGVVINLPADQVVHVIAQNGARGYHFFGGKFSADEVLGTKAATNNGLRLLSGSSCISAHGSAFNLNNNSIQGTGVTDIWLRGIRADINRSDNMNFTLSERVKVEGATVGSGARGEKICFFGDGRAPIENISSDSCTAQGGQWLDTAHNDVVQAFNECADFTITDNTFGAYASQGVVTFGQSPTGIAMSRIVVARNVFENAASNGISLSGTDIDVQENTVTTAEGSFQAVIRVVDTAVRVRGGKNVAPLFENPPGVDLASPTINGSSEVVAPEAPRIILPPWAPPMPTPPAPALTAPEWVNGGGIRWIDYETTPATLGTWLTLNRGQFSGVEGVSWQYRWYVDDAPVPGATSQIFEAVSGTIKVEARGQNAQGWGAWASYEPVVVA